MIRIIIYEFEPASLPPPNYQSSGVPVLSGWYHCYGQNNELNRFYVFLPEHCKTTLKILVMYLEHFSLQYIV